VSSACGQAVSPQYARVRAHIMGYYKCQAIACPTVGAEPAPARARLANAAPTRTAAVETMVAFAQVPRRLLADRGSLQLSSTVGCSGACNTGTAPDRQRGGGGALALAYPAKAAGLQITQGSLPLSADAVGCGP
jgi:hypothetical protein